MSATSMAPAPVAAPVGTGTRRRRNAGLGRAGVPTYLVALVFIAICIGPVVYIILGGFRRILVGRDRVTSLEDQPLGDRDVGERVHQRDGVGGRAWVLGFKALGDGIQACLSRLA